MVQVDIFWSYGLSAGAALAAAQEVTTAPKWWDNKSFLFTTLWTACVFAPSGIYLLWSFPGWETMFVAKDHSSLPAWLVTLFAVTNVTQGILGFYVTSYLLRKGHIRAAVWQPIWAHAAMLFVLIFGWDGQGYRRFLYAGTGQEWHAGIQYDWTQFFSSPVFYSLLGLGIVFLPTYGRLLTLNCHQRPHKGEAKA